MAGQTRELLALAAEGFCYPWPGQVEHMEAVLEPVRPGGDKDAFRRFLGAMGRMGLSEREELYTRTLDLNPPAAPYVGYVIWGESYQRGNFLALMSRALKDAGVEAGGELPDHLIPVLRYLAQVSTPLPDLVEIMPTALERMQAGLRRADANNPYLDMLEAAQLLVAEMEKETA